LLYDPDRFERLIDEPWDEERVCARIRAIVTDAEQAFDFDSLWPAEEWDGWDGQVPLTNLYVGASGVMWALDALGRRGHAEAQLDVGAAALRVLEAWRSAPDFPQTDELPKPAGASFWMAESGPLLVAWRLAPSPELADALHARVRENARNEANEIMWGAPGTMLAAGAMLDWTGEERWADAWRESADELWRRRGPDGLWTQHLYGQTARSLGPPHGLVGNTLALLNGGELLADDRRDELTRAAVGVLARNAIVEDGLANWPGRDGGSLEAAEDGQIRVQWCCGAPGIVVSASTYLDEELLLAGSELIWRAGPHGPEKGAGICHGTAGNGYALLRAFERTGDEQWLDRARQFAVHALEQVERLKAQRGRGRYSLWTGDVGTALFAADCLEARASVPIIDSL
jgi:hypothetical protein